MGATYTRRPNGTYLITVHNDRQRERKVIKGTKKDAQQLVEYILSTRA